MAEKNALIRSWLSSRNQHKFSKPFHIHALSIPIIKINIDEHVFKKKRLITSLVPLVGSIFSKSNLYIIVWHIIVNTLTHTKSSIRFHRFIVLVQKILNISAHSFRIYRGVCGEFSREHIYGTKYQIQEDKGFQVEGHISTNLKSLMVCIFPYRLSVRKGFWLDWWFIFSLLEETTRVCSKYDTS